MITHPKPFVFFGSLFLHYYCFCPSVCLRVSSVSVNVSSDKHRVTLEHSQKNLSKDKDACVYEQEVCEVPIKKLFI